MHSSMLFAIMAREIVKNLKFKKYPGKFDPAKFAEQLNEAYLGLKRQDGFMQKKTLPAYYNDPVVKLGYCRGNIPIKYVSDIYDRYEMYRALAKH